MRALLHRCLGVLLSAVSCAGVCVSGCEVDERPLTRSSALAPQAGQGAEAAAGAGGTARGGGASGGGASGFPSAGSSGADGGASDDAGGAGGTRGAPSEQAGAGGDGGVGLAGHGSSHGGAAAAAAAGGGAAKAGAGGASAGGKAAQGGASAGGHSASLGGAPPAACADLDSDGVADCGETLARNASFDSSVAEWSSDANASATWDAVNAGSSGGSGSLLLVSSLPSADVALAGVAQCLSVSSSKAYAAHVQVLLHDAGSYARLNLSSFSRERCQGEPSRITVSPLEGTTDSWRVLSLDGASGAQDSSLLVRLELLKLPNIASARAHFDNALIQAK